MDFKDTISGSYVKYLSYDFLNLKENFYIKSNVYLLWHVYLNVNMTGLIPKRQKETKEQVFR